MNAPIANPLLLYMGSKWRLGPKILSLLPPHRVWVECFGGSAALTLQKDPSPIEIYNDLDEDLVNLFQVLRSDRSGELIEAIALTAHSRVEYNLCFEHAADPVERARRLLVRLQLGRGSNSSLIDRRSGFRTDTVRGRTRLAAQWSRFPEVIAASIVRLKMITLEQRPAIELMGKWDDPSALLYLDPPYLPSTRSTKSKGKEKFHVYRHEMSVDDHAALLDAAVASSAMVAISGYHSGLYDDRLAGWRRFEFRARAMGNRERVELLWLNDAASNASAMLKL